MLEPLEAAMRIASSGLEAQSLRLRVVAENLANAQSTGSTAGADPYRRKTVTFESEIEQGAWLTTPVTAEYIFYEGADLWEEVTRRIRESTLQSMLNIKHVPEDPSLN